MKRLFSFLLALGAASVAAHAQSTMPAMGTNTPKGQVAKTDASINQTGSAKSTTKTSTSTTSKRVRTTKTTKVKSTGAM